MRCFFVPIRPIANSKCLNFCFLDAESIIIVFFLLRLNYYGKDGKLVVMPFILGKTHTHKHFNPGILERDFPFCCSQRLESKICIVWFCKPHLVRGCFCGTKWHRDCEWPNEEYTRLTSKLRLRHRRTMESTAKKFTRDKIWLFFSKKGCLDIFLRIKSGDVTFNIL